MRQTRHDCAAWHPPHRRLHWLVVLGAWLLLAPALAPARAQTQAAPPALTAAEAQQVLDSLRDEARRTQMLNALETLIRTLPAAPAAAQTAPPVPPAPPPAAPPAAATAGAAAGGAAAGGHAPSIALPGAAGPIAAAIAATVTAPPPAPTPAAAPAAAAAAPAAAAPAAAAPAAAAPAGAADAAATAAGAVAKLPIPLQPDSLGADLLVTASDRLSALSLQLADTARAVTDFPLFGRWIAHIATDPDARHEVLDTAWKLAVLLAAALVVERGSMRLLRRMVASLAERAPGPDGLRIPPLVEGLDEAEAGQTELLRRRPSLLIVLRRLPYVLGRLALDLLPIIGFAAVGYALLGSPLGSPRTTRLVELAVLDAYVLCRAVITLTRVLVAPDQPRLRLLHLQDDAAAAIVRWVRRIAIVTIFGYALAEVALLFGLYRVAHDALIKLVVLSVHIMLIVVVLQQRRPVAEFIRGKGNGSGTMSVLRARLARLWHVVAIFYLIALWLVWAFEVQNGFARLIRIFVATVVGIGLARLAMAATSSALERLFAIEPELAARYPGLEDRLRTYQPMTRSIASGIIVAVAAVALAQAYGLDSLSWFAAGALGDRVVSALITIGLTLVLSVGAWEVANAMVQQHLARLTRDAQAARAARLRTLLPMFRTALLVGIALVAGLTVLSEIGVNIAPLLAGAGVVGIAIGFGSQKLVQDIITGLFLLLENTMQVGDVVTLGGLSGSVENLSIRTIRLRAVDGSVHIVPFSAVTTVTNMTKDYGYAVIDVSAGLNEDPDRIIRLIRDVADQMRGEPRWAAAIRDDIEIWGIDKFVDLAYVIRARVMTLPGQRWAVGRELNLRIKHLFDKLAIQSPITSFRALGVDTPVLPTGLTATHRMTE